MRSIRSWCMAVLLLTAAGAVDAKEGGGDYVVVLHGLARTSRSMNRLSAYLSRQGYTVLNFDYPSRKYPVEELAGMLERYVREHCTDPGRRIDFVTHSLGGIIVRCYLKDRPLPRLGRVVMLAPPNKGSEVSDRLKNTFFYRAWNGPAGQQLCTAADKDSVPCRLGKVSFELGVIAGDRSANPYFSRLLPGKDDGKVAVESAKVEGMKDFLVVHRSHTVIMNDRAVLAQVDHFLKNGCFSRERGAQ